MTLASQSWTTSTTQWLGLHLPTISSKDRTRTKLATQTTWWFTNPAMTRLSKSVSATRKRVLSAHGICATASLLVSHWIIKVITLSRLCTPSILLCMDLHTDTHRIVIYPHIVVYRHRHIHPSDQWQNSLAHRILHEPRRNFGKQTSLHTYPNVPLI